MKGYVPTPAAVVDFMVAKLFAARAPKATDLVIDPGCGDGAFIEGILRYCEGNGQAPPNIVGIDLNEALLSKARAKTEGLPKVQLVHTDYLVEPAGPADFIIGNPPYVSITGLDAKEKATYKARFSAASGRFDLYLLFFEQSLRNLRTGGALCFITPEKFEYVHSAAPLRKMLTRQTIDELVHIDSETFPGLVTYPTVTVVTKRPPPVGHRSRVHFRDGTRRDLRLPSDGQAWSGTLHGKTLDPASLALEDLCIRISCGIATGADEVFVVPTDEVPANIKRFAIPTISGRQLGTGRATNVPPTSDVMLVPYDKDGRLLPEGELGPLGPFLTARGSKKLSDRTCVASAGRPWYRFHDNVPMSDLRRPKLLCKDIAAEPHFWADQQGVVAPRHSVYYIVPKPGISLNAIQEHLNSDSTAEWLRAHCQRAANDFLRLQSSVLRRLPVPAALATAKDARQAVLLPRYDAPRTVDA